MSLAINTNVSSLVAQGALDRSGKNLATNFERLSTGLRINSAKDDAAGLQISNKLTSQINGLSVAVRNANDGISLAQTAEGALQESTDILQRIRDLAVQSSSDVNGASERDALQGEVSQLVAELGRIADTTSFGGVSLLDGTFTNKNIQIGAEAGETVSININSANATALGTHVLTSTGASVLGTVVATVNNGITAETDLTFATANGGSTGAISYAANASAQDIADAINSGASGVGIKATASNSATLSNFAIGDDDKNVSFALNGESISTSITSANDLTAVAAAINGVSSATGVSASFANANDLSSITLSAVDGRDISLESVSVGGANGTLNLNSTTVANSGAGNKSGEISLSSTKGAITASNQNADVFQSTNSSFNSVSTVNVSTYSGAQKALGVVDSALDSINSQRAELGALQNRLDSTVSNLGSIIENVSAARSQIQDTDFAAETASLAKNQVLQQAGLSILAQANSSGQAVLSLLQ